MIQAPDDFNHQVLFIEIKYGFLDEF